ncbi:MAG TPA: hypothetical protein VGC42_07710 [Kofleriaceae bacterium]
MKVAQAAGLWIAASAGAGCTHAGGTVPVDSPTLLPYKAPDIDELTGIDSEEEPTPAAATPAPTPAPVAKPAPAQNQHK